MNIFDRKKWTLDTLIADVKQNRLTATQAAWYANKYYIQGFFTDEDMAYFAEATAEPETISEMEEITE